MAHPEALNDTPDAVATRSTSAPKPHHPKGLTRGVVVFQLEHTWSAGPHGAHYVTVLDLGARSALIAPVNYVLTRRFPDNMVRAWVRHNIEEVGQLEYLLPDLHAAAEFAVR